MATADRPNILLFVADGVQPGVVRPQSPCLTPACDRVAQRGVRVDHAYTTLPTCSPARASLMTGLLPHNHGMTTVEHTVPDDQSVLRRDKPHFAQRLREAGYQTAYFGKWHIERTLDLKHYGWDIDKSASGKEHRAASEKGIKAEFELDPEFTHYQKGPDGYNDTLHYAVTDAPLEAQPFCNTTRDAVDFIKKDHDKPWAACVSFFGPNEAMLVSREYFDKYDWKNLPLPANLRDDMEGKPNLYKRGQKLWADMTDDQWRQALACYYGRVSEHDAQLGQVLDALEATGQLENTVVIVTADHGKYVGSHGLDAHNFAAFEEAYGIPMIAAGPGIDKGVTSDSRVGLHDVCPTILELAGAKQINNADSKSFAPLLRDPLNKAADYQTGFAEYHGTRFLISQRVYWEGPWKFIFNGFDFDEMYNLEDDPNEMRNLANDPAYEDQAKHMMKGLWARIRDTDDMALHRTHYFSMRYGIVGPNVAEA